MPSARRRTGSSNIQASKSRNDVYSGQNKPHITLQRRLISNPDAPPRWIPPTFPVIYNARKLGRGLIVSGILAFCLLVRLVRGFGATPADHIGHPTIHNNPFPNIASITHRGRMALNSMQLGAINVSTDEQVTFVIPVPRRDPRNMLQLITHVHDLKCQIHLLVDSDRVAEVEYLIQMLLPRTGRVLLFAREMEDVGTALAILHHAKSVKTPWMWIMTDYTTSGSSLALVRWINSMATTIPRFQVPVGPHGARLSKSGISCVSSTQALEPVAYLIPPFLAPTALIVQSESGIVADTEAHIWASLGERIGHMARLGMGGVVVPVESGSQTWCKAAHVTDANGVMRVASHMVHSLRHQFQTPDAVAIQFVLLLPNEEALRLVAPTVCRMLQNGNEVRITVQASSGTDGIVGDRKPLNYGCHLHYSITSSASNTYRQELASLVDDWCTDRLLNNRVLIISNRDNKLGHDTISKEHICATAVIYLPWRDLENSEWLAMLTTEEWRAWDKPGIELAVITHDRPWSLQRLLRSVKQAHYFGDTVNVVINLEQTADAETRQIAEEFTMRPIKGHVTVRHRIVYAGLMTAVVESWYPHGDHSYGVLLEDDVELSPMFYAWAKFSVLRYRYGTPADESFQLYGVSLYQSKVTELHMEGRRPFDARGLFTELGLSDPHTPYLSQVPCSWGAVYFPEHWREFQKYLALRLSEYVVPVTEIIVPDLRSNKWSRSWKKFFNEMGDATVYLRGYVSLYPNYDHFVSLSTNHLEVGEHVPANINQEKQRQYFLPLMQETGEARLAPGTERGVKLLDLPSSTLPKWSDLPVLDLWGRVSSLERLRYVGVAHRANRSACPPKETQPDALEFLCSPSGALEGTERSASPTEDDEPDLMQG